MTFTSSTTLIITHDQLNQRLDNFLSTRLKGLPKSCLYRLIRQGKVRINKKRSTPKYRLQTNDTITLPRLSLNPASQPNTSITPALTKLLLGAELFEDQNLLILNKPPGLAVHGGSGIRLGLIESLRQLYPPYAYLELAHRLDRETSGCIVIAKKPSILKNLHSLFRAGNIKKNYLMIVKGQWPKSLKAVEAPLKKSYLQSGERMVSVHATGKPSHTQFFVRKHFHHMSLVEAILHTGRTHQIRVHTKYAQHPILGDEKYGDKRLNQQLNQKKLKGLFLHAHEVSFILPELNQSVHIKAPLPSKWDIVLNESFKDTEGGT